MRRSRSRFAVFGGVLALGCAARVPPPSAPAPALDRPGTTIPADLDLVLRVDLDRARSLFGPTIASSMKLELIDAEEDPATAEVLSEAIARAEVVWVALRPGLAPRFTDNVLVLRGRFGEVDPPVVARSKWASPIDLGSGFRLYEQPTPHRRSAPTRIYARTDDWLVFVSTAEVDAVERTIEARAGDPGIDPPDRGIVSVAARVGSILPLLSPSFPAVAEALAGAERLDATAEADDRGLRTTLEVRFASDHDASLASGRARLLLSVLARAEGLFGTLARAATARAVASMLVVRVDLDRRGLARIVGCLGGGTGC